MFLATPGDRISNLKVLIKFLAGSSSSEAQTHPILEGVSLESLVLGASPGQVTACPVLASPEAAGPMASGWKVEPCPAALQPCELPPFLCSVGHLKFCVCSQHSSSLPKPGLMQAGNRKWPYKPKSTQKAQRRGGHCVELLLQRILKRSSRERTSSRQAHRMLLCGSPLSLA